MKKSVNSLNGYRIYGNENDERHLESYGLKRLTPNKDILTMERTAETLLERLLNERYPEGANDSDDYFIASRDGMQYLILENAGQWFVGVNAADEKTGTLVTLDFEAMREDTVRENILYVKGIIEKMKTEGSRQVRFDPSHYDAKHDIPCIEWDGPDGIPNFGRVRYVILSEKGKDEIRVNYHSNDRPDGTELFRTVTLTGREPQDFEELFYAVFEELHHDAGTPAAGGTARYTKEADEFLDGVEARYGGDAVPAPRRWTVLEESETGGLLNQRVRLLADKKTCTVLFTRTDLDDARGEMGSCKVYTSLEAFTGGYPHFEFRDAPKNLKVILLILDDAIRTYESQEDRGQKKTLAEVITDTFFKRSRKDEAAAETI